MDADAADASDMASLCTSSPAPASLPAPLVEPSERWSERWSGGAVERPPPASHGRLRVSPSPVALCGEHGHLPHPMTPCA